jgi:hypothetical protein
MKESLALAGAAENVTGMAVLFELSDMAANSQPAFYLSVIISGSAA